MEAIVVKVEYGYEDEARKIAEEKLVMLDENLKNNPSFVYGLSECLKFILKAGNTSPLEFHISNDGRRMAIYGSLVKDPEHKEENPQNNDDGKQIATDDSIENDSEHMNEEKGLQNNSHVRMATISLDAKNRMETSVSSGTYFQFSDYYNSELASKAFKKDASSHINSYRLVLGVHHEHSTFLENGIQVESSTISDTFPLFNGTIDKRDRLIADIGDHAPRDWNYFNLLPILPCTHDYYIQRSYRFAGKLGIVHVETKMANQEDLKFPEKYTYAKYESDPQKPHLLATCHDPISEKVGGRERLTAYWQGEYPKSSLEEVEEEVCKSFDRAVMALAQMCKDIVTLDRTARYGTDSTGYSI